MELEAAKAEGDLHRLSYLDTPRGVNPVVQKLPVYQQKKGLTLGSEYKEEHKVPYPPFTFFMNFVCQQAKMQNDPSFALTRSINESPS